jgi:hypothetical protein
MRSGRGTIAGDGEELSVRTAAAVASRERGVASVELLATLPFLGLALLAAAQFALAGATLWSAAISARAGARAAEVGADARAAARRALPAPLREGSTVSKRDGVEVHVRVPALLPALPPLGVAAHSSLGPTDDSGS